MKFVQGVRKNRRRLSIPVVFFVLHR